MLLPIFATAWLLGDGARRRRALAIEMAARAEHLERSRTAEAAAAVSTERNRIAREMHDVVAHHIAMMVVQAEAGPVVAGTDPRRAVESFDAISAAGKQALSEMRRLVGVLKEDEGPDGTRRVGRPSALRIRATRSGRVVRVRAAAAAGFLPRRSFTASSAPSVRIVQVTAIARARDSGVRAVLSAADRESKVGVGPSWAAPMPSSATRAAQYGWSAICGTIT